MRFSFDERWKQCEGCDAGGACFLQDIEPFSLGKKKLIHLVQRFNLRFEVIHKWFDGHLVQKRGLDWER